PDPDPRLPRGGAGGDARRRRRDAHGRPAVAWTVAQRPHPRLRRRHRPPRAPQRAPHRPPPRLGPPPLTLGEIASVADGFRHQLTQFPRGGGGTVQGVAAAARSVVALGLVLALLGPAAPAHAQDTEAVCTPAPCTRVDA